MTTTTTELKPGQIRVSYWAGTLHCEGVATTYRGAMRIAARNRNAYGPNYYDHAGRELHDDGNGLRYVDGPVNGCDYAA